MYPRDFQGAEGKVKGGDRRAGRAERKKLNVRKSSTFSIIEWVDACWARVMLSEAAGADSQV